MSSKTILFGNIVGDAERQQLDKSGSKDRPACLWQNEPDLKAVGKNAAVVFVDLDDPKFAAPEFLVSLATAGERIKLIGKSEQPPNELARQYAPMGVSEILNAEQCFERLRRVLDEAEVVKQPVARANGGGLEAFIGISPQMGEIRRILKLLSEVDFPSALILGETGTGKSLVSRILHRTGLRGGHNLVEVNCSAIPDELFESELFGHVKGAFTDAKNDKKGLFEFAENGTIFLDEVGNLTSSAQAKLLKVIEDKKLRPVGTVNEKDINVRVVAATNANLDEAIKAGTFREDLYFRLNLLTINMPPLRERPEDVQELVEYYLGFFATNYSKTNLTIDPDVMEALTAYNWPGNAREVCNVVERAILMTRNSRIKLADINVAVANSRITIADRQQIKIDLPPQGIGLDEIEVNVVKQVLNMFEWNRTETARFLKISRPRLRRLIQKAGLEQNRRQT